jgi:hypothetical protein
VLSKLTPKDYVTDITFPAEIILEAEGALAAAANAPLNVVNLICDANKEALTRHWG